MSRAHVLQGERFESVTVGASKVQLLLAAADHVDLGGEAWPVPGGIGTEYVLDDLIIAQVPVGTVLNGVEELHKGKHLALGGATLHAIARAEDEIVDLVAQGQHMRALELRDELDGRLRAVVELLGHAVLVLLVSRISADDSRAQPEPGHRNVRDVLGAHACPPDFPMS